jgi:hypothetical protein
MLRVYNFTFLAATLDFEGEDLEDDAPKIEIFVMMLFGG